MQDGSEVSSVKPVLLTIPVGARVVSDKNISKRGSRTWDGTLSNRSLRQNGGGTLRETKGPAPILTRFALYRVGRDPFGLVEKNTVSFLFN